jgi:hypothetical protein
MVIVLWFEVCFNPPWQSSPEGLRNLTGDISILPPLCSIGDGQISPVLFTISKMCDTPHLRWGYAGYKFSGRHCSVSRQWLVFYRFSRLFSTLLQLFGDWLFGLSLWYGGVAITLRSFELLRPWTAAAALSVQSSLICHHNGTWPMWGRLDITPFVSLYSLFSYIISNPVLLL